ncbi:MAG: hypothetical protein HC902_05350 [Calothrix sp. SM1_5_4]|nr:hypothetical protein [Calothrix sp. SM1_5_4]
MYADDVKANHGASIGRMDEDELFYLMSRGIRQGEARRILAHAFVADVLMKIPSAELRTLADERVREILTEFVAEMEA